MNRVTLKKFCGPIQKVIHPQSEFYTTTLVFKGIIEGVLTLHNVNYLSLSLNILFGYVPGSQLFYSPADYYSDLFRVKMTPLPMMITPNVFKLNGSKSPSFP